MRIGLAFRAWWKILFDQNLADSVAELLQSGPKGPAELPSPAEPAEPEKRPTAKPPKRSEAITLLAALQREARFVDMVKEPLGKYSDAQIGAAARDVLQECGQVLDRLFGLAPLVDEQEGSPLEVPSGYDAGCFRLSGNVEGQPPFPGRLVHHGWKATRCELPRWTGKATSRQVVAPAEVEIKSPNAGSEGDR